MMGGFFDVYVLSRDRSRASAMRFLDRFLPKRNETADDYSVPNNSDLPRACFDDIDGLFAYLEQHPKEPHAIYWTSEAQGDPRCAMVFPTADGQMVYGLSVEGNEHRFLAELMTFLNSVDGYIDFEAPPPDNAPAFAEAVRRFRKMSQG